MNPVRVSAASKQTRQRSDARTSWQRSHERIPPIALRIRSNATPCVLPQTPDSISLPELSFTAIGLQKRPTFLGGVIGEIGDHQI